MYKVAIIGAGPAGISASLKCAKNRIKCVLIDKSLQSIGGVCLNKGCIPSKFYIKRLKEEKNISLQELFLEKEKFIASIRESLINYLQQQRIDLIFGEAQVSDKDTVKVNNKILKAQYILVCTGSSPKFLEYFKNCNNVLYGEDFFSLKEVGDNILIVGAGATGIELSTILSLLGRKVTLIEKESCILPGIDKYVAHRLEIFLKSKGIEVLTSVKLQELDIHRFNNIFLCTGRVPNNIAYGFKDNKNIMLCGDARGETFLAYTASFEAEKAVDSIIERSLFIPSIKNIPYCVFGFIPLSWIDEEDTSSQIIKKTISLAANPLAKIYSCEEGFIRIGVDKNTHLIKSVYIFGEFSWEWIHIFKVLMDNNLPLDFLKDFTFIHPSFSETVKAIL